MDNTFIDVQALASLKYFTTRADGMLTLRSGVCSSIIDFHTHIGWGFRLENNLAPGDTVFPRIGASVDLRHYSAHDFTKTLIKRARRKTISAVLAKGRNYNTSASHLREEMSALRIKTAILLSVDIFGTINSDTVLKVAQVQPAVFTPFISLRPRYKRNASLMKKYMQSGARGMKIHPPMQLIRPNSKLTCRMIEYAQTYNIPVLFHCGHTPLSPKMQKRFANMDDYAKVISWYPKVTFILGHSGIDQYEEAIHMAKKYENIYLELSGQPAHAIQKMIATLGAERLLFGSDWPYYPTALPLAKVLLATERNDTVREKILYTNALSLLKRVAARF